MQAETLRATSGPVPVFADPTASAGRALAFLSNGAVRTPMTTTVLADRLVLPGLDLTVPAGQTVALVGTTGAGKTRLFDLLVTQAVLRGEAVVIIDPKGDQDLRHAAERACRSAGESGRFVHFHPAFPKDSARIDPLHSFNRATEVASRRSTEDTKVSGKTGIGIKSPDLYAARRRHFLLRCGRFPGWPPAAWHRVPPLPRE